MPGKQLAPTHAPVPQEEQNFVDQLLRPQGHYPEWQPVEPFLGRLAEDGQGSRRKRNISELQAAMNKLAQQKYRTKKREREDRLSQAKEQLTLKVQQGLDLQAQNEQLAAENTAMEAALHSKSDQVERLRMMAPQQGSPENSREGSGESVFNGRPHFAKSAEQLRIEEDWFTAISNLQRCLEQQKLWHPAAEGGPAFLPGKDIPGKPVGEPQVPEGQALGELAQALEQVVIACCEVAKMEGLQMAELLNRTYETCGNLKNWREPERWLKAAGACGLSTQQKRTLIMLRMECLDKLKTIFEQRQELSRKLVDVVVPQAATNSSEVIANSADDNDKLLKLTAQLEANLREEQEFNVQMLYAVFRFQLNPVQSAWLILRSFPEHVDALGFMNAVQQLYAQEMGIQGCAPSCSVQ